MEENYAVLVVSDEQSGEFFLLDTGTKEAMSQVFDEQVIEGSDTDVYLVRVIKSAEITQKDRVRVINHGDEE